MDNCEHCKRPTEIVDDHTTGDLICTECAHVLQSHFIDTSAEWRTFSDDNNDNSDPIRVGHASNPLLDTNYLTTFVDYNNSKGTTTTKVTNFINRSNVVGGPADKAANSLLMAYDRLRGMADRLGLVKMVEDSGCEIYKKVFYDDKLKTCRGRNVDAVLGACLLVACQLASSPRTVKEICSVVRDGDNVAKKDVLKAKNVILKQLAAAAEEDNNNDNGGIGLGLGRTIRAVDIVKRFCYKLRISDVRVLKAVVEAASNCEAEEVDVRRSPVSLAAALIYVVVQLKDNVAERPLLKEIASATNVAEGTIRNTFKDVFPYVRKIVPTWYANDGAIHKLCAP
ncbi:hypothetical protein vseg_011332 [Gypsophila vaccaria]